jgi:hypothetical protein
MKTLGQNPNTITPDLSNDWAMDGYFIANVNISIRIFVEGMNYEDLNMMLKSIESLVLIVTPQLIQYDVDFYKNIKARELWCKGSIKLVEVNANGNVGVNPYNKFVVEEEMKSIFGELLCFLQQAGMYRKKKMDANKAMGNFRSS